MRQTKIIQYDSRHSRSVGRNSNVLAFMPITIAKPKLRISCFDNKYSTAPQADELTWLEICTKAAQPEIRPQKDGTLWNAATYGNSTNRTGGLRHKNNLIELSMLMFDFDHDVQFDGLKAQADKLDCAYLLHTTYSHGRVTDNNPEGDDRLRLIIPLAQPVPRDTYTSLWKTIERSIGFEADRGYMTDWSKMSYMPSKASEDSPYRHEINHGKWLDWTTLNITPEPENYGDSENFDSQFKHHAPLWWYIDSTSDYEIEEKKHAIHCPGKLHSRTSESRSLVAYPKGSVGCNAGCRHSEIRAALKSQGVSLLKEDTAWQKMHDRYEETLPANRHCRLMTPEYLSQDFPQEEISAFHAPRGTYVLVQGKAYY